ncbi:MAG: hypothetical protein DDT26_01716 [Dehalococcoidia bacterium]|nr:hypothetical protein [Chloroflexota bacterium]
MNGGIDKLFGIANFLPGKHLLPSLDHRIAWCPDVLMQRNDYLLR